MPETCIFMIWTPRKSFIRLGQATDQKCHLGLIRLRIFKMRWVSVANDHLGPKLLISDSATRRSLWPLECQPVALDDNEWQISKTLIQSSIQIHGQVSKKSYFDIWHFWKYGDLIIGAGAGAGAGTFCPEPEPEPQNSFTRSRSRIASPEPEPEPTKNVTAPHPCSYGIPHGTLNTKHTSNQEDSVIVWLASHVLPYLSLWVGCRL